MRINYSTIFIFVFTGLFISFQPTFSQEKFSDKEDFLEAESYFEHEEFSDALPLYLKIKDKHPENFNLDYRIGRCYISIPGSKQKSITYLDKATQHYSRIYKEGKFTEINAPVESFFYLGVAYRVNNNLDKAISTFKLFKTKADSSTFDLKLVDYEINCCNNALSAIKKPVDFDEETSGGVINTRYTDINPVVNSSDNVMVYVSKLPFYDAVFYTRKINGKWTTPVNMMPEIGEDDDCYPVCLSKDGNELYIYRSDDYRGDLYVTNFVNGKWGKLRKLNANINTKYWESHASLSDDGKTLYFTSNREGTYGGLDIYKSERTSGDNWGPAVNLGPVINSVYNEDTPFIIANGKRLYFSSFGHNSIGGYDIYYSELNKDGVWTKPQNLGYPVNTTDDDLFFCPVNDGNTGYISVFDPKGEGRFDIKKYHIYTSDNPRKYNISATIQFPDESASDPSMYIVLVNKLNGDTVLKQNINGNTFSFQAIPGKYDAILISCKYNSNPVGLEIVWGSKDLKRNLNFTLQNRVNDLVDSTPVIVLNDKNNSNNKVQNVTKANNEPQSQSIIQKSSDTDLNTSQTNENSNENNTKVTTLNIQSSKFQTDNESEITNRKSIKGFWFGKRWFLATGAGIVPVWLLIVLIVKLRKKKKNQIN